MKIMNHFIVKNRRIILSRPLFNTGVSRALWRWRVTFSHCTCRHIYKIVFCIIIKPFSESQYLNTIDEFYWQNLLIIFQLSIFLLPPSPFKISPRRPIIFQPVFCHHHREPISITIICMERRRSVYTTVNK